MDTTCCGRYTARQLTFRLPLAVLSGLSISCRGADAPRDGTDGGDWPGYGRTHSQQHYCPLSDINSSNVSRLRLAWWFDIPGTVLATSVPLEVDGTLHVGTGYSVVRGLEASNGRLRWQFDPQVAPVSGHGVWSIRGLASWNRNVYVGTDDGRLIALDSTSGKPVWAIQTTERDHMHAITGPPLAFNGRIVIGHGASDVGPMRGYVTAYDADTGHRLWRFFAVPGDPSKGFENSAMEMAARTWAGKWWLHGGGATVWNAITYDPELDRVYAGTGNGSPWSRQIRSSGGGDNLFVASIVALDAASGSYIWMLAS